MAFITFEQYVASREASQNEGLWATDPNSKLTATRHVRPLVGTPAPKPKAPTPLKVKPIPPPRPPVLRCPQVPGLPCHPAFARRRR